MRYTRLLRKRRIGGRCPRTIVFVSPPPRPPPRSGIRYRGLLPGQAAAAGSGWRAPARYPLRRQEKESGPRCITRSASPGDGYQELDSRLIPGFGVVAHGRFGVTLIYPPGVLE